MTPLPTAQVSTYSAYQDARDAVAPLQAHGYVVRGPFVVADDILKVAWAVEWVTVKDWMAAFSSMYLDREDGKNGRN